ncbi:MAG: DUF445 family protein [SAR324 cluster bacterium]|nr:DUF445 family protein [SAR324 cluster bacterium]
MITLFQQFTELLQTQDFWLYASMPFISAIVGWGTNVVAIKMMFYPIDFFGYPPYLGWQGIIPAKSEKMAALSVDIMVPRLISVKELFENFDPSLAVQHMAHKLETMPEYLIEDIMENSAPTFWESVPQMVKDEVFRRIQRDLPEVFMQVLTEMKNNIEDLFDVKQMVIRTLMDDKALGNEMFLRVGSREFKFIEHSGFHFGFLFGLLQMGIWFFIKAWWILPLAGAFVGYATNWLALKMVFKPIEPKKVGPFTFQGVFLKRQPEVAEEYGKMVSSKVLTPQRILDAILHGTHSAKVLQIVHHNVKHMVDNYAGLVKPLFQLVLTTKGYIDLKNMACDKVVQTLPDTVRAFHPYMEESMNVSQVLCERMKSLTPLEFERILHPVFEQDEWILIAVGAVLGACAGLFQLFALFGEVI